MNRARILFCLGLGVTTLVSGSVIPNCTYNSSLSTYIARFSSSGCLDQNLLFSNFHYTRLTSAALPDGKITANDPSSGLSFYSAYWSQPTKGIATSALSFTVTARGGAMLTGGVLNLSGAHGGVTVTQICTSGCSPGIVLLGSAAQPYLTTSFAPVRSIKVLTLISLPSPPLCPVLARCS
jgi:hypothetical protein